MFISLGMIEAIQQIPPNWVLDGYFISSYKRLQNNLKNSLVYLTFRTTLLLILNPINFIVLTPSEQTQLTLFQLFLILAFAYNAVETVIQWSFYYCKFKNKTKIYRIAHQLHHSLLIQDIKNAQEDNSDEMFQNQSQTGFQVSADFYDFQNMERNSEVGEVFRAAREANGAVLIKNCLQNKFHKCMECLLCPLSVGLFAFGIALTYMEPVSEVQHTIIQLFLLSEVLFKPKIYIILLIAALIPVLCVLVCIFWCCCRTKQKKAVLPLATEVTTEILGRCSECSICFQNYSLQEEVIVLPCSNMHVFHETCIKGWTKIKPTCPICRHQLI